MSKKINDGGPAFPCDWDAQLGMSRRDWFAGQALMGMLASENADEGQYSEDVAADRARRMADALVAALVRPVNAGGE